MSENYTGTRVVEVEADKINELYSKGSIEIWDKRQAWYPNLYLELIDITNPQHTALGKVKDGKIVKLDNKVKMAGLKPRNKEQVFAFDALLDSNIELVVLTGRFGSGKTLAALAAGIEQLEDNTYKKFILSKPMTQIGKHKLGTLPGEADQKFNPYLINYESNFQQIMDNDDLKLEDLLDQYAIEFRPIQLFLGASFRKTYLVVDEASNLETLELGALLSRAGEGSKIVIMGDYKQNHDQVNYQGIKKLVNDTKIKNSPLTAVIELQKCERGALAQLIGDVFNE